MHRILIIEDDFPLNNALAYNLRSADYTVDCSYNSKEAFEFLKLYRYILLILDINLPDANGFDLYSQLKEKSGASIIFLTANDLESDIIKGFNLGADDYITKPFSPIILLKKIEVLTRYIVEKQQESIYEDGFLLINFSQMTALINEDVLDLSPLEYRILQYFILNKNHILKREQLLEYLWDSSENFVGDTSLNTAMSRLRKKIEIDNHHYIKTIYGTGYMWIGN